MAGIFVFLNGLFSFIVPVAWALILYPFFKFYRKDWRLLVIFAVCLSLGSVYAIGRMNIAISRSAAGMLGLLFGTALIVFLFVKNDSRFSKKAPCFKQKFSLRGFLNVAVGLEERSALFYESSALLIEDPAAREACLIVALDERNHIKVINLVLDMWLLRPPDRYFEELVASETARQGMYAQVFPAGALARDVIEYAIDQETKMSAFYFACKDVFPEEWKKGYVQLLVEAEEAHIAKMVQALERIT